MFHVQAKQHENPSSFLTVKFVPIDKIPEASSDFHFHDCDEWWIIADGMKDIKN